MDSQRLQLLIEEIQSCIDSCNKEIAEFDDCYWGTFDIVTNNELRSVLIEQSNIYSELQSILLARMRVLYDKAQADLTDFHKLN